MTMAQLVLAEGSENRYNVIGRLTVSKELKDIE
jgi:hypothetical protein